MRTFAIAALMAALTVTGCATAPIPEGYTGPRTTVWDTSRSEDGSRAVFFYLDSIGDRRIDNTLTETRKRNAGRGFQLTPVLYHRQIPAQTATLRLKATVAYGAPIQEMLNASTVYTAERSITVTLDPQKSYVVRGTLTAQQRDVWLEDQATGARVD